MKNIEHIENLIIEINNIKYVDENKLDAFLKKGGVIVKNIFGENNKLLQDFQSIRFSPYWAPSTEDERKKCWEDDKKRMINLLNAMKFELENFDTPLKITNNIWTYTNPLWLIHKLLSVVYIFLKFLWKHKIFSLLLIFIGLLATDYKLAWKNTLTLYEYLKLIIH